MNAYQAFAGYPLHDRVVGCPCCTGSDEVLRRAPLDELTEEDLGRYAFKALTTWGSLADYKHFLPRILELSLRGGDEPGMDPLVIAGKLEMGRWHEWPAPERAAIQHYFQALWGTPVGTMEFLEAAHRAQLDVSPFLERCDAHRLADLVQYSGAALNKRGAVPADDPLLSRQLTDWLREPARRDELERAFFASTDAAELQELSVALQILDTLLG